MRANNSPYFPSGVALRYLGGLLSILIAVGPAAAGKSLSGTEPSATTSTSTTGSSTKKPTSKKSTHVSRHRRHQGTVAQRRARTARLKLAFVASTELRPM